MRIIGGHDYYDHCVGKFGFDSTRTYDRRGMKHETSSDRISIAICGLLYYILKKDGRFYFEENSALSLWDNKFLRGSGFKTNLNEKYRSPVVCELKGWNPDKGKLEDGFYIPNLEKWGFAKIIPAEEMYMRIYDYLGWLIDNPEKPNNQTDKEKVVSHGFDVKTSFRPKIKKQPK